MQYSTHSAHMQEISFCAISPKYRTKKTVHFKPLKVLCNEKLGGYRYRKMLCAGILEQSMGARNRVGIGLVWRLNTWSKEGTSPLYISFKNVFKRYHVRSRREL